MKLSEHRWLVAALVLYVALSFWRIDSAPKVWGDESWIVVPTHKLATEGRLTDDVCGAGTSSEEHVLAPGWAVQVPLAASIRLFGMHLVNLRGVPILFGLLSLVALYGITRAAGLPLVATVLVLTLTIADNLFFVSSRTLRPEIFATLVAVAAFYFIYCAVESGQRRCWVLSGVFVGIGAITHPVCLLLFLGLVGALLSEYRLGLFARKDFWWWIVTASGVFLPFAAYLVAEDLANGFRHFHEQMTAQGRGQPIDGGLVKVVTNELQRYAQYTAFPGRLAIALVNVAAVAWAWRRRDRLDRYILFLIAAHVLGFTVLFANKSARYFTVLMPFVTILVVRMVLDVAAPGGSVALPRRLLRWDRRAPAAALILLLYAGNQLGGDAFMLVKHRGCSYGTFVAQVRELIPDGARVWGSLALWLGLYDHPYRAEYTNAEDLDSFRPEYVILYDSDLWGGRSSTGRQTSAARWKKVRTRVEELVRRRGVSVGAVPDACYGDVEVYRIDWDRAALD